MASHVRRRAFSTPPRRNCFLQQQIPPLPTAGSGRVWMQNSRQILPMEGIWFRALGLFGSRWPRAWRRYCEKEPALPILSTAKGLRLNCGSQRKVDSQREPRLAEDVWKCEAFASNPKGKESEANRRSLAGQGVWLSVNPLISGSTVCPTGFFRPANGRAGIAAFNRGNRYRRLPRGLGCSRRGLRTMLGVSSC